MFRPLVILSVVLVICLALGLAWPGSAAAHGDLDRQITEVSQLIRQEQRKRPLPAHELAQMHLDRGELHRLHRDWRRAEEDYAQAARYEPDLHAVDLARSRMLLDAGRPRQAKVVIERYLRHRVDDAEGLLLHAQAIVALGAGGEAVRLLDRAIGRLARPEPDHYVARAEILAALQPPRLFEAIEGMDAGIARLGPLVSLDSRAIQLELALGRHDAALARVDRQAAASVRKDIWRARRADILERAGRGGEARAARREALELLAGLPPPLRSRKDTLTLEQQLRAALGQPAASPSSAPLRSP